MALPVMLSLGAAALQATVSSQSIEGFLMHHDVFLFIEEIYYDPV